MQVIDSVKLLRQAVQQWRSQGLKVALVPTMGNLHQGHLSLVQAAQHHADRVMVSIFVNPLQFGPDEDFDRYPRTFEADCQKLRLLETDGVFAPSVDAMYPLGRSQTTVCAPESLSTLLEGASRPGHFDGVTTVVTKLFNLVQPDLAVFGQKDFQQWRIIDQMVTDLAMPIEILRAPIQRDTDGLALSSRNQYLTERQRRIAPILYAELSTLAKQLLKGERDYPILAQNVIANLLGAGFDEVDYLKIVNIETLQPATPEDPQVVILVVARLGSTRLLDNIVVSL